MLHPTNRLICPHPQERLFRILQAFLSALHVRSPMRPHGFQPVLSLEIHFSR